MQHNWLGNLQPNCQDSQGMSSRQAGNNTGTMSHNQLVLVVIFVNLGAEHHVAK